MHPIRAAIHLDRLTRRSYDEREGHMGNKVVSIGYQERSLHELLHVLKAHNVGKLIDVRQLPLSRRRGFSKTALAKSLATKRIAYCHIRSAGNPYHSQKANLSHCLNLYARYLARKLSVPRVPSHLIHRIVLPTWAFTFPQLRSHFRQNQGKDGWRECPRPEQDPSFGSA